MYAISIFDMLKIGVGPSSSHTLGPWKAALAFAKELVTSVSFEQIGQLKVDLYGSLALTGIGHGTDLAVLLGLSGENPETILLEKIQSIPQAIQRSNTIQLAGRHSLPFSTIRDVVFRFDKRLPFHSNGMKFTALSHSDTPLLESIYYSIGGGFISKGEEVINLERPIPKHPCNFAADILKGCSNAQCTIAELALQNECCWENLATIKKQVLQIWEVMRTCVYKGCHTKGILPGGLKVKRRAADLNTKLLHGNSYNNYHEWLEAIAESASTFPQITKWIGCFAIAVNEENAAFSRVVTAPTNGSAGVIPAVLHYYLCFVNRQAGEEEIIRFLLIASQVGSLFKLNATISAAAGGCQAEIGVSSAMAAAALTELEGGSPAQALVAAEIAMEHHLGLTCDPIKGLVQVPCIERNSMGAIKAIMATHLALETDPDETKVSLDQVIKTMKETAQDMHEKYKETSTGGLAVNVTIPEC